MDSDKIPGGLPLTSIDILLKFNMVEYVNGDIFSMHQNWG